MWAPWRLTGRTGRNAGIVLDVVAVSSGFVLFWMFLNVGEFDPGLYRGGFLLVALVSALLIAATVHPATKLVPKVLAVNVFLWIGVRSYGIYLWHWPIYMVTRPHSDVPITGIPLLVIRLTLTLVAAALSYKYIEEPIRHGAVERQWARYRRRARETQRKLMARFTLGAAGIVVGLVIIVIGLGNGGSAAVPAAFGKETEVVVKPGDTPRSPPPPPARPPPPHRRRPRARPPPRPGRSPRPSPPSATRSCSAPYVPLIDTVDTMFNAPVMGVDAAENRQFAPASTTSSRTRTRASSARTSWCSSAPTAPSTPASSIA